MTPDPPVRPVLLRSSVQHYDWGSHTALASFRGEGPSERPEAELWIGAHPSLPSMVGARGLDALIAADPLSTLGITSISRFGESLPFLLKVLAAEAPLSLQAHPNRSQAEAGFANEEAAGIPRDAPTRIFKDKNHKPELLCALTDFEALCGFRAVNDTAALLEHLATPSSIGMAARLRKDHAALALRSIVIHLLSLGPSDAQSVLSEVLSACDGKAGPFLEERQLALNLAERYPNDVGALISLLMNRVVLRPGQALFLTAGNLHAYIRGVGVELMANSDNVLRCGLTPKHVDVQGLLAVLDWNPLIEPTYTPVVTGGRTSYPSRSPEFSLERIVVDENSEVEVMVYGPELLWCQNGNPLVVTDQQLVLTPCASAFVPAMVERYMLRGPGTVFRATVGAAVSG